MSMPCVDNTTHTLICEIVRHMSDDLIFVTQHMPNDDQARFHNLHDRARQWLVDQADAALSTVSKEPAPADDGWRDIASAPRDGTRIMAWWPGAGECGMCGIAEWVRPSRGTVPHWTWDGAWTPGIEPTHWRPLPAAPARTALGMGGEA